MKLRMPNLSPAALEAVASLLVIAFVAIVAGGASGLLVAAITCPCR